MSYQGDRTPPAAKSSKSIPLVSLPTLSSLTLSIPDSCLVTVYRYSLSLSPETDNAMIHALATKNSFSDSFDSLDIPGSFPALDSPDVPFAIYAKKKYKPVAQKVRPIATSLPERFRIIRNIRGDPLASIPALSPIPPPFVPTGRYTLERRDFIDKVHDTDFLWPAERALMHHFMCLQNEGFAWDDTERGRFRDEFFPPVEIPVVEHKPWVLRNIPIPPGIYDEVCTLIHRKIAAGVYEPSNSSYRSRWFCVVKKDGKSLRIVHSLEPLNAVTIQHSGVPPFTDLLAEQFAGRVCGGTLDLYVGYDERSLAETSRDYTTFQSPFGALRLVTLPMGWTNSVPVFHEDVTHILRPEIPHVTVPFIDDVPVKGPDSDYRRPDGSYETLRENPGIRRFVWEHFQNVNRVVQRMKYSGGTFSGTKAVLCAEEFTVVGHRCTPQGRVPDQSYVAKISNWGPCRDLSDVRAFLGTVGVLRIFIRNFSLLARPLVILTRKLQPFVFGPDQIRAQLDLKHAVLTSPALRPIDYTVEESVILSVDTSQIAVGYILSQCDAENATRRHYARFGSITLNDRESRFSQPKLEIYGLFRALRSLKLYLIGVRNLVAEVDARYIKGMLSNPDIAPSASINRWIISILAFHFTLVHVPGIVHGPDGLSRRPAQPEDLAEEDDGDEFDGWIDRIYGFAHILNPSYPRRLHDSALTSAFTSTVAESDAPVLAPAPSTETVPPRNAAGLRLDERIDAVRKWHGDLERPSGLDDARYTRFLRYCAEFFVTAGRLWRKDPQGKHKIVLSYDERLPTLRSAHDDLGHKGFYATRAVIRERFWWPQLSRDIIWFVRTCHLCQLRQTKNVLLPPSVATPAPIFAKMYMDSMHMPPSGGFHYIAQGRCSLTHYPEFRLLRKETAKSLGDWIFKDVLCRWGALTEIVSDNGAPYVKALDYLAKRYHIHHIRISGYNSRANGLVERTHFDVRQALFKASDGDQAKWCWAAHSVFWADRVTVRRRMGCSPYFAVTGTHPILPFDITEATYLLPPPSEPLSTTDLISRRAIALQKRRAQVSHIHSAVFEARRQAALKFEREHDATIRDFDFPTGALVLVRNTAIEKALNRKMRPRYLGPLIVILRNKGGAYILCELDGSVLDRPTAAFRVIPYFARATIPLPPLTELMDITTERLRELEATTLEEVEEIIPGED